MSDTQSLQINGLNNIVSMLKGLPAHLEQEILQKYLKSTSIKHGTEPIKAGITCSAIGKTNIKVSRDRLLYLALVSGPTTKAFWLRFADKGTKERVTASGANRGKIVGKFKIPSIIQGQVQPIIDESGAAIGEEIDKFLRQNNHPTI